MGLRLKNSSGNYVELNAPSSIATDFGLTLPVNDGDSGQYLQTNGTGTLSWQTVSTSNLTRGTAAATTSGTEVDFTSLPTGIRKITLVLDSVSVNTGDHIKARFSTSSTFATTSYVSNATRLNNAAATGIVNETNAFMVINNDSAGSLWSGKITWYNVTGNIWAGGGNFTMNGNDHHVVAAGTLDLGGTLDGLRLFSLGTFDNGQINIFYEV